MIKINNQPLQNFAKNTIFIAQSGSEIAYGSDRSEYFINDWIEISATPEEISQYNLEADSIIPEINDDYAKQLSEIIHNMASEKEDNTFLFEASTNAYLQIFLVKLSQYVNSFNIQCIKTNFCHPYYTKFVKIRERLFSSQNEFSISDLCSELKISESHFRRCYKEIFHTPVHKDIILHKIELSQQLLKDPNNYTIVQIANMLGYNNHEHFFRQFKKVTHLTPSEYRDSFYESLKKGSTPNT